MPVNQENYVILCENEYYKKTYSRVDNDFIYIKLLFSGKYNFLVLVRGSPPHITGLLY